MVQFETIFKDMMHYRGFQIAQQDFDRIKNIKKNLDVLTINKAVFGASTYKVDASLRCYTEEDVLFILQYKELNKMTKIQTALHFKMSRNTIAKWMKTYQLKKSTNPTEYYLEKKISDK